MPSVDRQSIVTVVAALAGGAAVLALGLVAASQRLPEWRNLPLPEPSFFVERMLEAAAIAELEVSADAVRVQLEEGVENPFQNPYRVFDGPAAAAWLADERRPLLVKTQAPARAADGLPIHLAVDFGLDGRAWGVSISRASFFDMMSGRWNRELPVPRELLLGPGESLGQAREGNLGGAGMAFAPVLGTRSPQYVSLPDQTKAPAIGLFRGPGHPEQILGSDSAPWLLSGLRHFAVQMAVFGITLLIFLWLVSRRRIDLTNALVLTGAAIILSLVTGISQNRWSVEWLGVAFSIVLGGAFVFLLWATAESWLRDAARQSTNALDSARRGRLGPGVGRGLLFGLAAGAALAGAHLATYAAAADGWAMAIKASIELPVFSPGATPLDEGLRRGGLLLLALAAAYRFTPRRWAPYVAALPVIVVQSLSTVELAPWGATVIYETLLAALLVAAWLAGGVLAVLVAAVGAPLFVATAFALLHLEWLAPLAAGAGLPLVAMAVLGVVGLRRPVADEVVAAPDFLRRLDEERRVRYEMDLLARMQLGLLPRETPQPPGWRIAATSMLAHEVGGDFYDFLHPGDGDGDGDGDGELWIAAGDVAGHGSSCSIAHAMTKAALASLVAAGRSPGEVLEEIDRVLRTAGTSRIFTALALVRLDPATGRGLFANAGYPYPLLRGPDGRVSELELAGLPLAAGPPRTYPDRPFALDPGSLLLFSSDGLYEAAAPGAPLYGFDRPRELLATHREASADELLSTLVTDWRRTIGPDGAVDDTTLLVVERVAARDDRG